MYPTNRFNPAPQTTVSVLRLVDYATVSLISVSPSECISDAAPAPARNDASATRFAFLSESRIVELGTPEMAYEQTNAAVDYYQKFSQHNATRPLTLINDVGVPAYNHHAAQH